MRGAFTGLFIVLLVLALIGIGAGMATCARAEEHHHPPEHAQLHDTFYSTWMMPDDPARSCCNRMDCAPAQARFVNGRWQARRDGEATWRTVPPAKIEQNRDTPDGRSHLCAPWGQSETVYCFIAGTGG